MTTTRYRKNVKRRLWEKQGGTCCYCGKALTLRKATFEHIVPRCLGGTYAVSNLAIACGACNNARGCMPQSAFLSKIGRAA